MFLEDLADHRETSRREAGRANKTPSLPKPRVRP